MIIVQTCGSCNLLVIYPLSQCVRFPTIWYVRPARAQTSLRIRAVWSEPLLVAWIFYECSTDCTQFGFSKLKRRLQRLVWVYTCQNVTLLEISCRGSFVLFIFRLVPYKLGRRLFPRHIHLYLRFYSNPYKPGVHFMGHLQTVKNQIRCHWTRCLITFCTVCLQNVLL